MTAPIACKKGGEQCPSNHPIQEEREPKPHGAKPAAIPSQYPSMKANHAHTQDALSDYQEVKDELDRMDDISAKSDITESSDDGYIQSHHLTTTFNDEDSETTETIKADLQVVHAWYGSTVRKKVYAIADSGADATIVGKHAKVLSYSGRKATIVGYEKSTTRSSEVPIVTALVKARSNIENGTPVLLKIHEAAYLEDNPITLISEYQVRESGMVIDSTANKHRTIDGRFGTQQLYLNEKVSIPFEDRGALMGFELLPIQENDWKKYDIFTITNPSKWRPYSFRESEGGTASSSSEISIGVNATFHPSSSKDSEEDKDQERPSC